MLHRIEVQVTEHCNLNCNACFHFSSIAESEFLDVKIFERDCKRLAKLTRGNLEQFHLLGGEPLLHPQLLDIIDIARKQLPLASIRLITNGLLLLKEQDVFWENICKNNIVLTISRYPFNLNLEKIREKATKFGVDIQFYDKGMKGQWFKNILDIDGKQDIYSSPQTCCWAYNYLMLYNGKLYACPMIQNIRHFNKHFNQNLDVREGDFIDLFRIKSMKEIANFLVSPKPFCRFCNLEAKYPIEWGISKKEITEWI